MAVAAVVAARHMRQHAKLLGGQRPVGDRDPQHVGMELEIDAVEQPQQLEFVLGQLAGQPAPHLVAKFRDALVDQRLVEFVVAVHCLPSGRARQRECGAGLANTLSGAPGSANVGPATRMRSRRLPGSTRLSGASSTGAI